MTLPIAQPAPRGAAPTAARRVRDILLACLISFTITTGLLLLMRYFVATDDAAYAEGPALKRLVFQRTVMDPEPPARRPPPKRPPPVEPPPLNPVKLKVDPVGPPSFHDPVPPPPPPGGPVLAEGRLPIPFLTPAPEYPQRALARGIEGWVLVGFTIAETGAVVDAVVVDAHPPGFFDAAALRALARYKYRPQLVAGVPTATPGMLLRIHFEIEGSKM